MAITLRLGGRQGKAGAPIALQCQFKSTDSWNDSYYDTFVGVTTSSSPPATYGALAHADLAQARGAYWDIMDQQASSAFRDGANVRGYESYRMKKSRIPLDANFVAGRYVWLLTFDSSTPGGSDAPVELSSPYLIR